MFLHLNNIQIINVGARTETKKDKCHPSNEQNFDPWPTWNYTVSKIEITSFSRNFARHIFVLDFQIAYCFSQETKMFTIFFKNKSLVSIQFESFQPGKKSVYSRRYFVLIISSTSIIYPSCMSWTYFLNQAPGNRHCSRTVQLSPDFDSLRAKPLEETSLTG